MRRRLGFTLYVCGAIVLLNFAFGVLVFVLALIEPAQVGSPQDIASIAFYFLVVGLPLYILGAVLAGEPIVVSDRIVRHDERSRRRNEELAKRLQEFRDGP